jgi:DNA recombination protein RmuC
MLSLQTFLLLAFLIGGVVAFLVYFFSNQIKGLKEELKGDENQVLVEWLKDMKLSVDKSSDVMGEQLKQQRDSMDRQTKLIWERLESAQEVIRNVHKQIGGIEEFGKDIKDLSNVLKSPKLRGGLGEQFLYEILANTLPADLYKTQYKFRDGSVCDAIIKTDKGIIPIDSKFPMENFKAMVTAENQEVRDRFKRTFVMDVKKRIEEISSKYILPEEKTTGYAIMYIPSENVYYELVVNTPQVEEYARQKNVIMTSPNTLSYSLKVLLVAFQQQELQKHAGEILKALSGIRVEAEKFDGDLGILERHISNASKAAETVRSKFMRLFNRIEGVQALGSGEESKNLLE